MRSTRKRAVTRSTATPGQLRIALENLMRNPWSVASVKDASEVLTGGNWSDFRSDMIPTPTKGN